ncbi:HRDC domain-containing protein [Bifidobacterium tibiigranuli]|jgi:ribonuclease D|uniref:HRDC domain-containing protein n=1 Tax=Bifidobacterium tibiigranuli TaxID=2172043 RepID=UPI0026ED9DE5|nr:HRDC domain-containing protein [Bifidobacterium tibiigranuli]MCI1649220.1 HRDC domain-containing protein [Bifidobacterium tibiigranuli]MCI2185789.1 HRDC domain-containing protein [Bifidobacterium tibiigranuli]MCI2203100.1 HRDC domain-containing protein [Bifidobacterium tibiigranuli]
MRRKSRLDDEPRLQAEPRGGVPDVIDTLKGFHEACERFAAADGSVAADAERASGFRYGHEDWLVQFKRAGAGIALFDPIALGHSSADWNEFNSAVGNVTWILHDSLQDLPGFADLGMRPQRLFDTEIAARLLNMRHFGLAAVTEHYLGLTLAKEHSAADWSYRPLPRDWRNYAALDVELLIELEAAIRKDLQRQGKVEWAEEEFAHALAKGMTPRKPHPVPWLRISHITALNHDGQGQAVAKALWEERDRLARYYDIAPTLLLSDSAIIEAARRKPHNAKEFRAVRALNERVRVHTGGEQDKMFERYAPIQREVKPSVWKGVIQQALELPEEQWPTMPVPSPDTQGNAPRSMKLWSTRHPERFRHLQAARKTLNSIAEDTRTPAEMILKPQIVRNLCWTDEPQRRDVAQFLAEQGARGWQIRLVAESLSRVII